MSARFASCHPDQPLYSMGLCQLCYHQKYYQDNRDTIRDQHRVWNEKNPDFWIDRNRHNRMEVLLSYGGECACCGETRYEFLEIDHINKNGKEHREEMRGAKIHNWLIAHGYPEGFRVLCSNCNQSLAKYGYCPHQEIA